MGCGLGSGSLVLLSSSTGMTWGLLCLLTLGDGVGITGVDCSSPSEVAQSYHTAKGALVFGPVSAAERSLAACVVASTALMCGNLDDCG
eukprot:4901451-Ditylum_brightwellii.AAC.1